MPVVTAFLDNSQPSWVLRRLHLQPRARLEGETKAQAGWEKKKATLEAEVERLTKETADLRRKLDGSNARLRDCQEKLEKVREQRNGHARELSQLQGHLQRMASGRR